MNRPDGARVSPRSQRARIVPHAQRSCKSSLPGPGLGLRRAYRSTLGREPDSGAGSWVDAVMKNNWSQGQLEAELRKSAEYRNKR